MMLGGSFLITILSFIKGEVITLRLISGLFLVATALSSFFPVMFVGFTSTGVSTYVTSTSGDPGRTDEPWTIGAALGFVGVFQIIYAFKLMLDLAFMPVNSQTSLVVDQGSEYLQ